MADHRIAHAVTSGHEAGWCNHPADKGGETWAGLTRRDHPDFKGWRIVDVAKQRLGLPATATRSMALDEVLFADQQLAELTAARFKVHYWDPLELDAEPSQAIANKAYDIAVNMGVGVARKFLAVARR